MIVKSYFIQYIYSHDECESSELEQKLFATLEYATNYGKVMCKTKQFKVWQILEDRFEEVETYSRDYLYDIGSNTIWMNRVEYDEYHLSIERKQYIDNGLEKEWNSIVYDQLLAPKWLIDIESKE